MQRKNNLLRKSTRSGMAMIMAIAVIVIVATIMAISIALTTMSSKKTVDLYIYEQAILLSKSAAEYGLLRISQSNPCTITNLNFSKDYYDINMSIRYIYSEALTCNDTNKEYFNITTNEQNGSVLMDIKVSVDDPNIVSEPIVYFRRSIQKL